MKKKLFAVLAATLAGTTLSLSACTSGDSKITFRDYWNVTPSLTAEEPINETLTYDVAFESYNSESINYDIDYKGTYTTTLMWDYKESLYVFTSNLDVETTFTVGNESETKKDKVYTKVSFHKAGGTDNLSPVSSYKEITSHTPIVTNSASTPKDCYERYDYTITTNYENGQGKCTILRELYSEELNDLIEMPPKEKTFNATSKKRSVLDNEQFPVAFRTLPVNTNTTVQMFNPFLEKSQKYTVSFSEETQEKKYSYKLNGNDVTPTIHYHTASIAVAGTTSGQAQSAEIATMEEGKPNTNRRLMLAYYAPLSQNIGVLKYTLKTAEYK